MAESFSERHGYSRMPQDHFIYEDAPEQLREYIKRIVYEDMRQQPSFLRSIICRTLLVREDPSNWSEYPNIEREADNHLNDMEWYQVYEVIESLAQQFKHSRKFEEQMNAGFRRLGIGWQLKDGIIQVRSDEALEKTVVIAQKNLEETGFSIAHKELKDAISDLSKRPEPDSRGAVRHAIGALESVARHITGDPKKTLGDIVKLYPNILPKPLDESVSKLWGYTSEYARHVREDRDIERKEAQLVLGISSTIITYLIESSEK